LRSSQQPEQHIGDDRHHECHQRPAPPHRQRRGRDGQAEPAVRIRYDGTWPTARTRDRPDPPRAPPRRRPRRPAGHAGTDTPSSGQAITAPPRGGCRVGPASAGPRPRRRRRSDLVVEVRCNHHPVLRGAGRRDLWRAPGRPTDAARAATKPLHRPVTTLSEICHPAGGEVRHRPHSARPKPSWPRPRRRGRALRFQQDDPEPAGAALLGCDGRSHRHRWRLRPPCAVWMPSVF
jgi:hypothetical protein